MRQETLEQILKVITLAAQRYSSGDGISRSYQHGVKIVAQEYQVTYQTIADACRRRLGLGEVDEFKKTLKTCFDGDQTQLRGLLLSKAPQHHDKINDFFCDLKIDKDSNMIQARKPETLVSYNIQMRKSDSDVLMALTQLLGSDPEKLLTAIAVEAIKDQMKKTVNQL